jgi:hypothetical protein
MVRRHAPVRVVERTAERIRLREDAQIARSMAYIGAALLCLALPFLVPSNMAANAARLWTISLLLLPLGLNRLLGTISTFDLHAGTVLVTRTLGRLVVFRRTFGMDDVIRVFHDRREYVRVNVQNPRLELQSGRRVNLSQWCPSKLDLESEVAGANRLLHRWKQTRSAEKSESLQSFPNMYAEACPREWTLEGLDTLTQSHRERTVLWAKRSGFGFLIGVAFTALTGWFLPASLRVIIDITCMAFLMATVVCSAFLVFDWMTTKRQ